MSGLDRADVGFFPVQSNAPEDIGKGREENGDTVPYRCLFIATVVISYCAPLHIVRWYHRSRYIPV